MATPTDGKMQHAYETNMKVLAKGKWMFIYPNGDRCFQVSASAMNSFSMCVKPIDGPYLGLLHRLREGGDETTPCQLAMSTILHEINAAFRQTQHNITYWEEKARNINYQLAQAHGLGGGITEATIREETIRPFLLALATAVSGVPHGNPKTGIKEFRANVTPEVQIAKGTNTGTPNKRSYDSSVDYLMCGKTVFRKNVAAPIVSNLVPVEVKKRIALNHYYQLAWYMMRLSTHWEVEETMLVGLLIDNNSVAVCFSPFECKCSCSEYSEGGGGDEEGAVGEEETEYHPLPVLLATPRLRWLDSEADAHVPTVNMDTLIFLGLLLQNKFSRLLVTQHHDQMSSNEFYKVSCIAHKLCHDKQRPFFDDSEICMRKT